MSEDRRRRRPRGPRLSIPPDRYWADASRVVSGPDGQPYQISPSLATNARFQAFGLRKSLSSDSRRATYRLSSGLNGLPALDYDGSTQISYLYAESDSVTEDNFFNSSAFYPQTALAVVTVDVLTDACIIGQGSSSNGFFNLWHTGLGIRSNGKVRSAIVANGGAICEGGTVATGSPQLLGAVLQSGSMAARLNRAEVATSSSTGTPHTYPWATIAGTDGNSTFGATDGLFNGRVHEILVYARRLSTLELAEAENYLYLKWQV